MKEIAATTLLLLSLLMGQGAQTVSKASEIVATTTAITATR